MEPTVRTVALPRTRMQITELGEGLPVIMCHGFPGLGYSWRHQMHAVAEAGFRSVAPDMLGYGVADAELARDPRGFLARLLYALSGEYRYVDIWQHGTDGNGYLDVLPQAPPLPWSWLTDADLDVMSAVFARTGFTGGLNWYRA